MPRKPGFFPMRNRKSYLIRDLLLIVFSIGLAVILAKTGLINKVLVLNKSLGFLGSFLVGILWDSAFTVAPATVALVEIAHSGSPWLVALFGGLGALVGDLLLFRFVKDGLAEDIIYLTKKFHKAKLLAIFHSKVFQILTPALGAILIATPLPDELGVTLLGLSKIRTLFFVPVSFVFNFLGIIALEVLAKPFLS